MTPKLTEVSLAVKMLKKMFAAGNVKSDCSPKRLQGSNIVFKEQKLDNFRTKFNKLQSETSRGAGVFLVIIFSFKSTTFSF